MPGLTDCHRGEARTWAIHHIKKHHWQGMICWEHFFHSPSHAVTWVQPISGDAGFEWFCKVDFSLKKIMSNRRLLHNLKNEVGKTLTSNWGYGESGVHMSERKLGCVYFMAVDIKQSWDVLWINYSALVVLGRQTYFGFWRPLWEIETEALGKIFFPYLR